MVFCSLVGLTLHSYKNSMARFLTVSLLQTLQTSRKQCNSGNQSVECGVKKMCVPCGCLLHILRHSHSNKATHPRFCPAL